MSKYAKSTYNMVFIDEVQFCDKFELIIDSFHSKGILVIKNLLVDAL